ncbi:MAG: type II toxin-antitoxin system ParD family antitoxin [Blastochloris sp.]|nr:type II toxin-antitoxin system ParD family antitoxin [Blastochloris sp.]
MRDVVVTLTDDQQAFVEHEIQRGDYQDTSAVVQAALRLLAAYQQERDATLHELRTAIDAGDASGEPVVLEDEATFFCRAHARYAAQQS